jgi:hypothetical protein
MPNINDLDQDEVVGWDFIAGKGTLLIYTSSGETITVSGSSEIRKWAAKLGIPY